LAIDAFLTRDSYRKLAELSRTWEGQVSKAVAEREVAEDLQKNAEEKWRKGNEEQARLKAEVRSFRAQVSGLEDRILRKDELIKAARARLEQAHKEQGRLAGENAELQKAVGETAELVKAAEQKAEDAEKKARDAEERANGAEASLERAELLLRQAGPEAVEAFKASEDFAEEVAEGSAATYILGFSDCRDMVARFFPSLDLGEIKIAEDEEEEDGAADEAVGQPDGDAGPTATSSPAEAAGEPATEARTSESAE
jgi:hypothetical protein